MTPPATPKRARPSSMRWRISRSMSDSPVTASQGTSADPVVRMIQMAPPLNRVGIVFAGGPAPGANSVIAVAASSFRRRGTEVIGILHGFSSIDRKRSGVLRAGEHYRVFEDQDLWGLRGARGIAIGTARSAPGREIASVA